MSDIYPVAEANAKFNSNIKFHTVVPFTRSDQSIREKYESGGTYAPHSHEHELTSVVASGRMRLIIGDEIRDIDPRDMWYAPANVEHGSENLDNEPVVFIDVYAPPRR